MYVCMYVYSLSKAMAANHNHRYISLTELLDPAQKKANPVVLDDDDDDDHSNYGHGSSDGDDDRYSSILSNNSSSALDLSKPPLPSPTAAAAAALSPLHDEDDDDGDVVKKKLSENNNCCKYDESAGKLLLSPAPIFSCLRRNKAAAVGCPCVYRELDAGKTNFIPKTVFLPHDITVTSSSSADHHEKGKKATPVPPIEYSWQKK